MSALDVIAILAAGLSAGILLSTVGFASLLSFPILLAIGIAPVAANIANTLGMIPAGLGGAAGYREELAEHPRLTWQVLLLTGLSGSLGAVLLLALPSSAFETVVPWLILITCLLVGLQPRISRWLARRRDPHGAAAPRLRPGPATLVGILLTGVYGGYFGAGAGVMMLATLSLGLDLEFRVASALRTVSVMAANIVAGLIFIAVSDVEWTVVGLIAVTSIVGGYLGARIARRLPAVLLRSCVVIAGIVTAIVMLT